MIAFFLKGKLWLGVFRAPARPTFVNSDKSRQKHRKEPPVPSPPGALYSVRTCDCVPHVHIGFSFSYRQKDRLCFCAAAAEFYAEKPYTFTMRRGEVTPPYKRLPIEFRRARCPHRAAVQRFIFYRCNNEQQRRKKKVDSSYAAIIAVFCERVAKGSKCVHGIACADS